MRTGNRFILVGISLARVLRSVLLPSRSPPFAHRLISQVLRLNLITASGSFPTVFHLQH